MVINADLERTRQERDEACKGIRNPKVKILVSGEILYRIASTINMKTGKTIARSDWKNSPWWVRRHDYRKIVQASRGGTLPRGMVARSALALRPSWNNADVSIKARLIQDIKVWAGEGIPQFRDMIPNGIFVTIRGWKGIEHLYIPSVPDSINEGLHVIRQAPLPSDNLGLPVE